MSVDRMRTAAEDRPVRRGPGGAWLLVLAGLVGPALDIASAAPAVVQDPVDDELAAELLLVQTEREEADLQRRRGHYRDAHRLLDELLRDDEEDALTWAYKSRVSLDEAEYERAERQARRAFEGAQMPQESAPPGFDVATFAARQLAAVLVELGRADEAVSTLLGPGPSLDPDNHPLDAWVLSRAHAAAGDMDAAASAARAGAASTPREDDDWRVHLNRGRCQRYAGLLEAASRSFIQADRATGPDEPDILVALADLYFESEREVEAPGKRSAGALYKEALTIHPTHVAGLVGQFELHRYNRRRTSRTPDEILQTLLTISPSSVPGLIVGTSADLQDGRLVAVRERLTLLRELCPGRRDVRALEAALAWVEHRRDDCQALLDALLKDSPTDSAPERTVGTHLIELYRFAEAVPFLERAVERDPGDWEAWTQLGEALANTGREDEAREALSTAKERARGRQDAFRNNLLLALERMHRSHVVEDFGELTFSWQPDAAEVLRTYMLPFYRAAREELAARYGFTPDPTRIEIFREHRDFSVRSVGFEGFPALGVCFGPVVTALSPLSEMRGSFSWARTGFHEFSHVVHLGLSNNRCPRWITEGLATWEEVRRNPTWSRNMRRDLVDAYHNDDLIAVRDLNRAFRGPRILFGYYQGGLLCEMLIERHGFTPMVEILQAFDLGADLDQAFRAVFDTTPEEVDAAFRAFVAERIQDLRVEPRWSPSKARRLRLALATEAPNDEAELEEWAEGWTTIAWAAWQQGRRIDAEEALRRLERAGARTLRSRFLEGEIALEGRRVDEARDLWEDAIADGGRDFRALVGLGTILTRIRPNLEEARNVLELAVETFPGYPDSDLSAERLLIELHTRNGDSDAAMKVRERWLAYDAGNYDDRMSVARWHVENGRDESAARLFAEANDVDPFRRGLHREWAEALHRLERYEDALREYRVALIVPPELDADQVAYTGPIDALPLGLDPNRLPPQLVGQLPPEHVEFRALTGKEEADLHAARAECFLALGRVDEAVAARDLALDRDAENERARGLELPGGAGGDSR